MFPLQCTYSFFFLLCMDGERIAVAFGFSFLFFFFFCLFNHLQHVQNTKRFNFIGKQNTAWTGQCSKVVLRCPTTESLFSLSNSSKYLPNLFYWIFCVLISGYIWSYLLLLAINRFSRCCRKVLTFTWKYLFARGTLFSLLSPCSSSLFLFSFLFPPSRVKCYAYQNSSKFYKRQTSGQLE